jgi:hypothetical protein
MTNKVNDNTPARDDQRLEWQCVFKQGTAPTLVIPTHDPDRDKRFQEEEARLAEHERQRQEAFFKCKAIDPVDEPMKWARSVNEFLDFESADMREQLADLLIDQAIERRELVAKLDSTREDRAKAIVYRRSLLALDVARHDQAN